MIRETQRILKEAEDKVTQASHRGDDAQLSKLKAKDENRSLKEEAK